MIESRRRAYLDAMGFDTWLLKPAPVERNRLLFSPGESGTLLVCNSPEASVTRFAGDVARALGTRPVWAWPDPDGGQESRTMGEAIGQYLFTRVILFGSTLGRQLFEAAVPEVVGSARIIVAPELDDLQDRGVAKQAFWRRLREMQFIT